MPGIRGYKALAERADIALDQGIGVFARYQCLGIAVRQGLELHQQFLAFFRLFRASEGRQGARRAVSGCASS